MVLRIIIVLGCVALFINSCNSLISGVTGTHRLRQFTMTQIKQEGIGDSDFIEVKNTYAPKDFTHIPPSRGKRKGTLFYPILEKPEENEVYLIAWKAWKDTDCLSDNSCLEEPLPTKGVVRDNRDLERIEQYLPSKYKLAENVIFLEINRSPLAWYWNLLFMLLAAGLAFGMENYFSKKQRKTS